MNRTHWFFRLSFLCAILLAFASPRLTAGAPPIPAATAAWPTISLEEVASELAAPVQLTHAGDGSQRAFIVEQAGRIRILKNGAVAAGAFLDISDRVLSGGEQGLLGLAFPPDFAARKHFYVYYTNQQGDNQVSRFTLGSSADVADATSEKLILYFAHPVNTNHNGGQIAFGPDGYLYIGTGDGGGAGDTPGNAQNPASLLGKILRIDVGDRPLIPASQIVTRLYFPLAAGGQAGAPYRIPSGNPFAGRPGYRPEIWATGLRNPWRFSFDRSTGDLYIADVGQGAVEEVNFQAGSSQGGENYGWNILEGNQCYNPASGCVPPAGYVAPVAAYTHAEGGCSVTGGFVYRGAAYPALQGIYLYADFCSGKIWQLQRQDQAWQTNLTQTTVAHPSSFGEDQAGELYLLSLDGKVYRVTTP